MRALAAGAAVPVHNRRAFARTFWRCSARSPGYNIRASRVEEIHHLFAPLTLVLLAIVGLIFRKYPAELAYPDRRVMIRWSLPGKLATHPLFVSRMTEVSILSGLTCL